jgi:protein-disulfide isomerase
MSKSFLDEVNEPWWKTNRIAVILISLILAILLGLGLYVFTRPGSQSTNYKFSESLIRDYNPKFGKLDSELRVITFIDFQCPACKASHPTELQVRDIYKDKVLFVYKNHPLSTLHPYAINVARTAMAVNKQSTEKYFDYANIAFDNQTGATNDKIFDWTKSLNIDLDQLRKDRDSDEIKSQVADDDQDLTEIVLPKTKNSQGTEKLKGTSTGTPTFVVMRGTTVIDWWTGGKSAEDWKKIIEDLINVAP